MKNRTKFVLAMSMAVILCSTLIVSSHARGGAMKQMFSHKWGSRRAGAGTAGGAGFNRSDKGKFWQGNGTIRLENIQIDKTMRNYYVYKPEGNLRYPAPTVFAFHGGSGTARGMDKLCGGITKTADRDGFVVVFPDGIQKCWNDGRPVNKHDEDDVKFISTVIDKLVADGISDRSKIYATGISNGGFFSQYLALKIPDKIAAVASVAATLDEEHRAMATSKPVPLMYILGVEDPLVPFDGGKIGGRVLWRSRGNAMPAAQAVDFWLTNNSSGKNIQKELVSDAVPNDGTKIVYREYGNNGAKNQVIVYEIQGGGHTWPKGWQYLPVAIVGRTSQELDANQVIWEFFSQHQL